MAQRIDYAASDRVDAWLHHPVIGDPSFDSFTRRPGNPVVSGRSPYEWTVNGSLFIDPPTGDRYLYVGLYPRGYWPAGGCQAFVSRDGGLTWKGLGIVLEGSADLFDGDGEHPGGTPDVTVAYHDGLYHMVYDWANRRNERGGIAYAVAKHPAGPFLRARQPIHLDATQEPILGRYVRTYGATLLRRKGDWLVLADMSTPGNAGGTWALVGMTASQPDGPYTSPTLLLYPQSDRYHPSPVEFFPCFTHNGRAYAPATSVAKNRSYQILYSAPLEQAHEPEAWKVLRDGSVWHDEPVPHEARGIWGQTFAGVVHHDGVLHVMFPSKTPDDDGTINLASRPLSLRYGEGFVVSAPNAPSLALLRPSYGEFSLRAEFRASGAFAVVWQHTAPLGPDRPFGADAVLHSRSVGDALLVEFSGESWTLSELDAGGRANKLGSGVQPARHGALRVTCVEQGRDQLLLRVDDAGLWQGRIPSRCGRIGVLGESGSIVRVERFLVEGQPQTAPIFLLPTEATMGSGASRHDWHLEEAPHYRFGFGCRSVCEGATAKWNYRGRGFRLWSPRGPEFGSARLIVDGMDRGLIELSAPSWEPSAVVAEDSALASGFHAVKVIADEGTVVCDTLEFVPS